MEASCGGASTRAVAPSIHGWMDSLLRKKYLKIISKFKKPPIGTPNII